MSAPNPAAVLRPLKTIELRVEGMDCPACAGHVADALQRVAGVRDAEVRLASQKAVVTWVGEPVPFEALSAAVRGAGYRLTPPEEPAAGAEDGRAALREESTRQLARRAIAAVGLAVGAVLLVLAAAEWFELFEFAEERVPFPVGVGLVLLIAWPPLRSVVRAALSGKVLSHTLMAVGLFAALAVGQWVTAAVVAFFMRMGDAVEGFTVTRGRRAILDLERLAPGVARREDEHGEAVEVAAAELVPGDVAQVRPGERIPADGVVLSGRAAVEQAAITGESVPADVEPGSRVFAATLARGGALRLQVERAGEASTFGRIVRMVEEAEGRRGPVQRFADRFSGWYLPVVATIALGTFLVRGDALAVAAVLVVACSCAFGLATPIAMLATIGASARRGLLIKGGRYIEALSGPAVLLLDKTGTVSLGRPEVVEVVAFDGVEEEEVLGLAAAAERSSEHPLADAIVSAARRRGIAVARPTDFRSLEGRGVEARVEGARVWVGAARAQAGASASGAPAPTFGAPVAAPAQADGPGAVAARIAGRGMSLVHVERDGRPIGVIGIADVLRPDVLPAVRELRALGFEHIELLTGDHEGAALPMAQALGISYRAGLLPEDKLRIVEEYQARGRTVVMVGDGVNDAPALARADVGVTLGDSATDLALEVADVALLRDDWSLLPEAVRAARRTMGVVRGNFALTAVYNVVGLSLAAAGILPPIAAAAAQSIPDLGILGNSARLLRTR